jgi:phosphoribosylanthranilate isomerase
MFQIKICGITTPEDALLAAEAGADAIGLNFYEKSPRHVTHERAVEIGAAVPDSICRVGVFVVDGWIGTDPIEVKIAELSHCCDLSWVQIHGDESPETSAILLSLRLLKTMDDEGGPPELPFKSRLVRAFRCRESSLEPVLHCLASSGLSSSLPDAVLLDAYQPHAFGGTGRAIDWNMVRDQRDKLLGLPLILAGGLTPENVAEAIATARPDAVDVASGVESSPGKKDAAKVREFVTRAKEAFAAVRP